MKIVWMRLRRTPARMSCSCVPSPQSNKKTSPSRINAVDERPRVRVGTAELVPSRTIFKYFSLARRSRKLEARSQEARSQEARSQSTSTLPAGRSPPGGDFPSGAVRNRRTSRARMEYRREDGDLPQG